MIPFNKPYLTGKETIYIEDAVKSGKISGNGKYTKMCQDFFENSCSKEHIISSIKIHIINA
jgi:dTDP-4-amino-4,6-dideoxygalactose transaminase